MQVLGIETTCDETAAAVVRLRPDGTGEILADEVMSQIAAHAAYGGVVPEIAARAHVEIIDSLVSRALRRAKLAARDLDGVAAAAGPGLIGGVGLGGRGFPAPTEPWSSDADDAWRCPKSKTPRLSRGVVLYERKCTRL